MRYRYVYKYKTGLTKVKTKLAIAFTAVALGAGGIVGSVAIFGAAHAAVGGPICNVPADYPTIQAAVSVAGCTTVNVSPGTYNENVVIGHTLTLNGAQATVDARGRVASESTIDGGGAANITITADNVTVDGFTLNGPSSSGTAAIVMQTANNGETIKNNIINNPGRAASITTSNTTFSKNAVNNTSTSSDGFQANSTPVSNLTISDNSFSGANSAIYNADITVIEGNSTVVVSGNSSTSDGTLIALFKTDGAQITNNTVVGTADSSAIYIGGANSNVLVSGNQVSSAMSAIKIANTFGDGVNSNVTITGNTLNNNQYGVNVDANSENGTVVANRNSLASDTPFGIFNDPASGAGTLNGTCNWWGAANGPGPVGTGTGSNVSLSVTFQPWLVSSDLTGPCAGGNIARNKDQCKNDGWMTLTDNNNRPFKNQGDCVSYVATGGKNTAAGPKQH
jgi:hypothetical protein